MEILRAVISTMAFGTGANGARGMTEIEQWEPTSTSEAIAAIDQVTAALDKAETVEEVRELRSMAEVAMTYVRRHDESQAVILRAQEIMREAERKLAYIMADLKAAGKVRGAGRPKKLASESQVSDQEPASESQISAREIFGDDKAQRDANLFATINDDEWQEAIAAARESGDLSRAALVRMLRTPRAERSAPSNGGAPVATIGNVVSRVIKTLTGIADALEAFRPEEVEAEDRKQWKADIREQVKRIDEWQKAVAR